MCSKKLALAHTVYLGITKYFLKMIVHYSSKWCILCKIMIFKGYKKFTPHGQFFDNIIFHEIKNPWFDQN